VSKIDQNLTIEHTHWDDIHVLVHQPDDTLLSGSKDNTLMKWDVSSGNLISEVQSVSPDSQTERNWITAATTFNDKYWLSGDRSGRITMWSTEGDFVRDIYTKLPRGGAVRNEFNKKRVTCLTPSLDPDSASFFAGYPTMFVEYSCIESKTISVTKVHERDWVYAIKPVMPEKLFVVVACTVNVWEKQMGVWENTDTLYKSSRKDNRQMSNTQGKMIWQKPFISSMEKRPENENQYALTMLTGRFSLLDVASKKIVRTWEEHSQAIWSGAFINSNLFATGSEDRTIKLWDLRQPKSLHTFGGHPGRVTAVTAIGNQIFAGACPSANIETDAEPPAIIQSYDTSRWIA
jgi:WD40 repeat protein